VTQVLDNDVYSVSVLRAEEGRQYATTVKVSEMISYHLIDSDLEEDDEQSCTTPEDLCVAGKLIQTDHKKNLQNSYQSPLLNLH